MLFFNDWHYKNQRSVPTGKKYIENFAQGKNLNRLNSGLFQRFYALEKYLTAVHLVWSQKNSQDLS